MVQTTFITRKRKSQDNDRMVVVNDDEREKVVTGIAKGLRPLIIENKVRTKKIKNRAFPIEVQCSPLNSGSVNSEIQLIQSGDYGPC